MDRLIWLSTFQHSEIAFQQLRGIKAGMRVKSAIHMRLHLDKHDHCFVTAIRHIEPFQNRPRDGFWHDRPPELRHAYHQAEVYQECPVGPKGEKRPADVIGKIATDEIDDSPEISDGSLPGR